MIVVQIMGGLGNQMFQYAFGRALEEELKTKVKYDLTFFSDQNPDGDVSIRNFELEGFNLCVTPASTSEINHYKSYGENPFLRKLYKLQRKFISSGEFFRETSLSYFDKIKEKNRDVYYSGYWLSYRYFDNIREVLLNEFKPRDLSQIDIPVLKRIKSTNSVSVHFRRGDYLSKSVSDVLITTPLDYYYKAFDLIDKKVPDPYYFIFSDEPEWVKQNLKLNKPYEIVYENQGKKSYIDMLLMSHCKNNIIANSSFSWWGAWLNSYKDKLLIAPEKWYKDPSFNTKDLLPDSWIKI
jgi:hypothetical protein